jgi:hypothetical protein
VGGDASVDSEVLLVTDFVNLKIKSAQSFGCAHRDRTCMRVLIGVSDRTCMSIYICTVFVFLKNGDNAKRWDEREYAIFGLPLPEYTFRSNRHRALPPSLCVPLTHMHGVNTTDLLWFILSICASADVAMHEALLSYVGLAKRPEGDELFFSPSTSLATYP